MQEPICLLEVGIMSAVRILLLVCLMACCSATISARIVSSSCSLELVETGNMTDPEIEIGSSVESLEAQGALLRDAKEFKFEGELVWTSSSNQTFIIARNIIALVEPVTSNKALVTVTASWFPQNGWKPDQKPADPFFFYVSLKDRQDRLLAVIKVLADDVQCAILDERHLDTVTIATLNNAVKASIPPSGSRTFSKC